MWVEQTKTGKFKYAERYIDPLTGKYKRVSVVLEKNSRQAQKQAQTILSDKVRESLLPKKSNITLSALVDLYREEQERTVKKSTYTRNYFACETLKKILGPDVLVQQLNAGYIRKNLLATGKEPGTLNEHLTRLKALLRWGYRNDYVDDITYLQKIDRFSDIPHGQKLENKFLEAGEAVALISGMEVKEWRNLTEFLILSGLRFGEAAALTRSDVDLKNRTICVTKNYDTINDVVTVPKTRTSVRDVYMQDELYTVCRRIMADAVAGSVIRINPKDLFFYSSDCEHINFFAYNKYLRENSERILGRPITPHVLRHTHASLMMENGMSEDSISRRLGHTNSRITREIYLHVTKQMQDRENNQMKSIKIL